MPQPNESPITVQRTADGRQELKLTGDLTVFSATEMHRTAVQLVEQGQDLAVDCDGVDSVDCAAVQILLALKEALAAQGKSLQFTRLSDAVRNSLALSGLDRSLGLAGSSSASMPPQQIAGVG